VQLVLGFVLMLLFTASMRATLRPEREGFAYLRIGMDEFNVFLVGIIFAILFFGFYIALVVVMGLAIALGFAVGGVIGAIVIGGAGFLAMIGVLIWFQVRFSLAYPLSLMRGRLVLGEAWALSRGRFWTLFGAYFAIGLLLLAIWAVVAMVTMGPYYAALLRAGWDPQKIQAAGDSLMAQQMAGISAMTVVGWILNGAIGGLAVALGGGAVATAARELAPDGSQIATEFA
jgi:hypothetical protein